VLDGSLARRLARSRADHGTPEGRPRRIAPSLDDSLGSPHVTRNPLVFAGRDDDHDLDDPPSRKEVPPMINTSCVTETVAGGADFAPAGMRLADAA